MVIAVFSYRSVHRVNPPCVRDLDWTFWRLLLFSLLLSVNVVEENDNATVQPHCLHSSVKYMTN